MNEAALAGELKLGVEVEDFRSLLAFVSICVLFAIGVTTKPGSTVRYLTVLTNSAPLWVIVNYGHKSTNSQFWNGAQGAFGFLFALSSFVVLVLKGYHSTFWEGLYMMTSPRFVSTVFQIKSIPKWARYYGKDYIIGKDGPSRSAFLLRQTFIWLWTYLLAELTLLAGLQTPEEETIRKHAPGTEWNFELTVEHWQFRLLIVIGGWFIAARAGLESITCLISMILVASGLQTPAQCPPNYSSVKESYTIRKFWG